MSTPYEQHVERYLIDSTGQKTLLFYTGRSTLSNFYHCPITVMGQTYPTAEHYYQCWKAAYFGDYRRRNAIYAEPRPGKAKHLAKKIENFDKSVWQDVAPIIMEEVLYLKYTQNTVARQKLLSTGDAMLVEATEFDNYWGSGLNILDDNNVNEAAWKGSNMLGFILMSVRNRIRA